MIPRTNEPTATFIDSTAATAEEQRPEAMSAFVTQKTVTIDNNGNPVRVVLTHMGAVRQLRWLVKAMAVFAASGFHIADVGAFRKNVLGYLTKMRDVFMNYRIDEERINTLIADLLAHVKIEIAPDKFVPLDLNSPIMPVRTYQGLLDIAWQELELNFFS